MKCCFAISSKRSRRLESLACHKKADVLGVCNFSLNQAKIASGYIEQPFSTVFYLTKIRKLYSSPQYEARCYHKKRWLAFDFKLKQFSIKQAFFISEIFSSHVKAPKQKRSKFFFTVFLRFLLVWAFFSKFEIFTTFLNNKISNLCLWHCFVTSIVQL